MYSKNVFVSVKTRIPTLETHTPLSLLNIS